MNFKQAGFNKGKVVYWINGISFENSKDKRDGKEKATQYCLDNFLNPADIKKFDSRTERDYYEYLLKQQELGKISNLAHHYTLKVQDEFINCNGDLISPITYESDFIYFDILNNRRIICDVKGSEFFIDERFITLKQVFDYRFKEKGLYLQVILKRGNEWIEYHLGEKKKSQKLIKKQREEIKTLRDEKHKRTIQDNKNARLKARLDELNSKDKLTKRERLRLEEIKELLNKAI